MSDQYEQTLQRLVIETEEGMLKWETVRPSIYERIIANVDTVVRAFKTQLKLKEKVYHVVVVEKKDFTNDHFGSYFERLSFEVYVLNHKEEFIFPIYEGLVDRDDLLRLIGAISDASDQTREFFEAFGGDD